MINLTTVVAKIFDGKRYAERKAVLAKIIRLAMKYDAFDMILTPEAHRWLKREFKGICYVSDNFVLGSYNVNCVVACDRTAFLRHERRR